MEENRYSIKEIKVTAMVYASRHTIVDHVRATGKLPDVIPMLGFPVAMKVLIGRRGTDPDLTEDEKMVYDAILRERRLPGGGVILLEGRGRKPDPTDTEKINVPEKENKIDRKDKKHAK
jgi:hypothetical protein